MNYMENRCIEVFIKYFVQYWYLEMLRQNDIPLYDNKRFFKTLTVHF